MTNKSNDWTEKYKPKKIKDLVTNVGAVREIQLWLSEFDQAKEEYMTNKAE